MKFEIESKELKKLLEKATPVIDKRAAIPILKSILLESKDNILSASTTNMDQFLKVQTEVFNSIEDGTIVIDESEVAIITKLSGTLTIETISEFEAIVSNGKKSITIKLNNTEDFPKFPESTQDYNIFIKESAFTKSINKLFTFTTFDNDYNKMMQAYNININKQYIEALDGHRIGINDIEITQGTNNNITSLKVHNSVNKQLKKVLSNKSDCNINITLDKHYVFINGKDFTYIQREIEGDYFKVDQMLFTDYEFRVDMDKKELMEIAKFNQDMLKKDTDIKKPMILAFNPEAKEQYSYMNTGKHVATDKFEIDKIESTKDLTIGFNPLFIYEALNCIDDDNITITSLNASNKAPILISGDNERYLILPVNIAELDILAIKSKINRAA